MVFDDNMASNFRAALRQFQQGLKAFQDSKAAFRVLATVDPRTLEISSPADNNGFKSKTLLILDSSFNPPSIAHQNMAETALLDFASSSYQSPHRLLLLFSTMNADKASTAASFDQRLTMMAIFATDLLTKLKKDGRSVAPVDIGVTTAPYYTDKSIAIEKEGLYSSKPKHVHLVGYDTITRVLAAKYYPKYEPPLSALNPYFDSGHEFRVTLRPKTTDSDGDDEEKHQRQFLIDLADGKVETDGGRREWAEHIHLESPNERSGVSSTKIRDAVKAREWNTVEDLSPPSVAQWVKEQQLYE